MRLTGVSLRGSLIIACAIYFLFFLLPVSPAGAWWTGSVRLLVVLVEQPGEPLAAELNPASVKSSLFTGPSAANQYLGVVSGGRTSLTGDDNGLPQVVGPYRVGVPSDGCRLWDWHDAGLAAARAAGFPIESYHRVVVIHPLRSGGCSGGNARITLNGGARPDTLVHELGHTFGASHASGVDRLCSITANVACSFREYGDYTDPMGELPASGGSPVRFGALSQWGFGWLDKSKDGSLVTRDGIYEVRPLQGGQSPRLLMIPRNDRSLPPFEPVGSADQSPPTQTEFISLEYRRPTGLGLDVPYYNSDSLTKGPILRLAPDPDHTVRSALSILIPGGLDAQGYTSVSWQPGSTFVDRGGLSVKVLSADSEKARVQVSGLDVKPSPVDVLSDKSLAPGRDVRIGYEAPSTVFSVPAARYELLRDGQVVGSATSSSGVIADPAPLTGEHAYSVDAVRSDGIRVPASASPVKAYFFSSSASPPDSSSPKPSRGVPTLEGKGKVNRGVLSFKLRCPKSSSGCDYRRLSVVVSRKRKRVTLKAVSPETARGKSARVRVKLSKPAVKLSAQKGVRFQLLGLASSQRIPL